MNVLLINGSPHKNGCTFTVLNEVAATLNKNGIQTELLHIGNHAVSGCMGCAACKTTKRCVIKDEVNQVLDRLDEFDGFVFGSPVHFASISGALSSFMDRLFYLRGGLFKGKLAAGVLTCRRGGATAAYDQINKYFAISGMPIVPSQYWNMAHGNTPQEILQDGEGLQTMRTLANNMAWLLKSIEAGKQAGITLPKDEERIRTNFIR